MGRPLRAYFHGDGTFYTCFKCSTHLGQECNIISKAFQGSTGTAYLFEKVQNVIIDEKSLERFMTTGRHVIRNIRCAECSVVCGWTYVKAFEVDQKYKEGKFIIEAAYLHSRDNSKIIIPSQLQISTRSLTRLNYFY